MQRPTGVNGHGDVGRTARRHDRSTRASPAPLATKESVDRVLRLVAEGALLDDLLVGANEIFALTESCEVFPVTLDTGDKLRNVDAAAIRRSAEQDQPDGVLRAALDTGRIANISVNNRRHVTFFCKDPALRSELKGTKVHLNGLVFSFPEEDRLMSMWFFEIAGFQTRFSTRELFVALHYAGIKVIAIYYLPGSPESKLDPTRIRVHVASKTIPTELVVNGEPIDQLCFQGHLFPVRCRGEGRNALANAFRERSDHCLVLSEGARPQRASGTSGGSANVGGPGSTTSSENGTSIDGEADCNDSNDNTNTNVGTSGQSCGSSHHDEEDEGSQSTGPDGQSEADGSHSDASSQMSDEEAVENPKSPLLDLSISVIDIDPEFASFTEGASVIDSLETSFTDSDFLTMQRKSKRHKPANERVRANEKATGTTTLNRFAALSDFDVEFDVVEWKLTDVAESSPLRVALKPKANIPAKVSKTAKSYELPALSKPSVDDDARVVYSTPRPFSSIASDVREALQRASQHSLDAQSDSAFFHASQARHALKNYADPAALMSEIKCAPLAHAFAFASEIQHNPYAFNSTIRLHTIQRCLAATDEDRARDFLPRAATMLDVAAPFDRSTITNKFKLLQELCDDECNRCLNLNDTLALFELLLMMIAPDFYFNDSLLTAYLKNPVMWLPATPERILHPLTLLQILATPLGAYIVKYIASVQPSNECVNQLVDLQNTDMATILEMPLVLVIRKTATGAALSVHHEAAPFAFRC